MNLGRELSFQAFKKTLEEFNGKSGIREVDFRENWLQGIRSNPDLTLNGWYMPPPSGIAVLFASDLDSNRISFDSLRKEDNWPSSRTMNWASGLLYAYSSFVDIGNGLPGDFAITLYFGQDNLMKSHFIKCHRATQEVLSLIDQSRDSIDLFSKSQEVFSNYKLRNSVISITDSVPLDLGHSLPTLGAKVFGQSRIIPETAVNEIRNSRKFINDHSSWDLRDGIQFTVEPQLKSLDNPELPQVSFHYVVQNIPGLGIKLFNQCDELLKKHGLT